MVVRSTSVLRQVCRSMSSASSIPKSAWPVVTGTEIAAFTVRCMEAAGSRRDQASVLGQLIEAADYRGHYSHGLNRLEMYVNDAKKGNIVNEGEPEVLSEKAGTAWVDGHNLLGPVVGKFCMELAIKKAKEVGIGWVVAKSSNHFGIAGWYSMIAQEQGLVGMAFTNTSPSMVPTRSREPAMGTNPICMAAPGNAGDSFVLDMATTTVARGKVEVARKNGGTVPNGWGCDDTGKESNDPAEILKSGTLFPLGGTEECGGYKGFGLSMMVEVFCGILAGSHFGNGVRKWGHHDLIANLGQCFVAIDPSAFAPGFTDRMSSLMDTCRNLPVADGCESVLVPGDPERQHMTLCGQRGGIPYHPNQITLANELASRLGVTPLQVKS